jgi:dihydrofolate reductase
MSDAARRELALIFAVSRNGVIGHEGKLPWHVPEDLAWFKRHTTGHAIIMGRRTHASIGRPLPNRRNIVVSRDPAATFPGCEAAGSLEQALALAYAADPCPFVIGGAELYRAALPLATRVYVTYIDRDVEGDTFLREWRSGDFEEVSREAGTTPGVTFSVLERRP